MPGPITQMLHVWDIYEYLPTKLGHKSGVNVGIHIQHHAEHLGNFLLFFFRVFHGKIPNESLEFSENPNHRDPR